MTFNLYGYARSDDEQLLALREVTVYVDAKQALALSEFFAQCARKMDANPAWEHEHFSVGDACDLIVFNARME